MSFYGMLRNYYDLFAFFWVSVLRVFAWFVLGIPTDGCGFIFPVLSLTIVNFPLTVIMAFFSQTVVGFGIFGKAYQTTDMVMFNAFFCAMLGVVSIALKVKVEKGKDDKGDSIIPMIILSSLAYAALATMWPMPLP